MLRTAVRRAAAAAESTSAAAHEVKAGQSALQKGAKRDPELYVCHGHFPQHLVRFCVHKKLLTFANRYYLVSCLGPLVWPDSTLVCLRPSTALEKTNRGIRTQTYLRNLGSQSDHGTRLDALAERE
jgi:hypothetical protein